YDAGTDQRLGPSAAKYFASEAVGRIADRAVQIHGGSGYMRGVPVERLYRDVRLFRIYEGTSQIQQPVIARGMLRQSCAWARSPAGGRGEEPGGRARSAACRRITRPVRYLCYLRCR